MAARPLPSRIVIPVANPATADELIRLGAALAEPRTGELTVLGVVEVAEGMPLSEGTTRARQARRLLQRVLDFAPEGVAVHPIVRIGHRTAAGILETATEQGADLLIFGWGGKASAKGGNADGVVISPTIDQVVREAPCDVAVVKQRGSGEIRRILVPVRGGPHAELALQLAAGIAARHGASVDVLHLVPPGIPAAVRTREEHALAALIRQHLPGEARMILREAAQVRNAILREAETADLVVMGASAAAPGAERRDGVLFGALPEAIATRARVTVMVVRTREEIGAATFEKLARRAESLVAADRAADEARALPRRVDRWFGESNFHHAEFADLERLAALKETQRLTVSLVLPTLNRAETIGPIVRRAVRELMHQVPLVDEILVIDAASEDATRRIAADEGARVVVHQEVLTRYGSFEGKGEALWKSLHETAGDIVVWAETDVRSWNSRLAYGTLGPLLVEPRIQYVKGYHQRPLVEGADLRAMTGGRVTELVARPLLNLFFPELSGLIEPLTGECAARRSVLEAIPFFTGDAVEIGHLIDVAERAGLDGLGQVDLERRAGRSQEIDGLSRTSFEIIHAVTRRLEERRKTRLLAELASTMKLPRSGHGRLALEVLEAADHERPPMIRIPEYLDRRRERGPAPGAATGVEPRG